MVTQLAQKIDFNPRSYKRSDVNTILLNCGEFISIHAPTRGATINYGSSDKNDVFQSTLLQEERPEKVV